MKSLFGIVLVGLLVYGCQPSPEQVKAVIVKQHQETQQVVDNVVNSITYIKDPRTSICYAYYWGGMANGGPTLATVPENSIPTNLLWIAHINK